MTEANFASHVDSLVGGTADTFVVCAGPTAIVGKRTAAEVRSLLSVLTSAQIAAAYQPIGSYAAASHTHSISDVTGLQAALDGKQAAGSYAAASHTHATSDITGFAEAVDDEVASLLVQGSGISLTYNDAANTLTIASTATGTIGGSTGATDNRVLRSDGTGGAMLQNSQVTIDDSGNVSGVATLATSALMTVSYANSGTAFGGTGVPSQGVAIVNTNGGTAGNPFGILFGGTSGTHHSGIFGVQLFDVNNRSGELVFATRQSSSDASLTEAMRIRVAGWLEVGRPQSGLTGCHVINTRTLASGSNLTGSGSLLIHGEGSVAADAGAGLVLAGPWSGTTWTAACGIKACKTNATGGDFGFDMTFHTRVNGGNATEKLRIGSTGAITAQAQIRSGVYTVATLPSASANAGFFCQVTDSSVTTFRGVVAGGGANRVMVFSDGSNWVVI